VAYLDASFECTEPGLVGENIIDENVWCARGGLGVDFQ